MPCATVRCKGLMPRRIRLSSWVELGRVKSAEALCHLHDLVRCAFTVQYSHKASALLGPVTLSSVFVLEAAIVYALVALECSRRAYPL